MAYDYPTGVGITGDLEQAFSRLSTIDVNVGSIMPMLSDRRYEPEVQTINRTHIAKPTYNKKVVKRARGDDWKSTSTGSQEFITLIVVQEAEIDTELERLDAMELPLNYLERERMAQVAALRLEIEEDCIGLIDTDANYDTSRTYAVGTAGSDFIDKDGTSTGSVINIGKGILDSIRKFNIYLGNKGALGPASGMQIGGMLGSRNLVTGLEEFDALDQYLQSEKLSYDRLTDELLTSNSIFANEDYMGTLKGVNIFATPKITKPSANGAANFRNSYMFLPNAWAYAQRPSLVVMIDPVRNQTNGPNYIMRQIANYGYVVLDSQWLTRIQVPTA